MVSIWEAREPGRRGGFLYMLVWVGYVPMIIPLLTGCCYQIHHEPRQDLVADLADDESPGPLAAIGQEQTPVSNATASGRLECGEKRKEGY